jgi:hypothetical protein
MPTGITLTQEKLRLVNQLFATPFLRVRQVAGSLDLGTGHTIPARQRRMEKQC